MEEMQEALRGKNDKKNSLYPSMLSMHGYDFSTDSLDDQEFYGDGSSSRRDSSTIVSEFSSTKTLMNIDEDIEKPIEENVTKPKSFFLSRFSSDNLYNSAGSFSDSNSLSVATADESGSINQVDDISIKKKPIKTPNSKDFKGSKSKRKLPKKSKFSERPSSPRRVPDVISRFKRDSSGNVVNKSSSTPINKSVSSSRTRSANSSPKFLRSASSKKLWASKYEADAINCQKNERACIRSKTRTLSPQSPSPTRAKRPRTMDSRELSQTSSPTRKRSTVDSIKEIHKKDSVEKSKSKKKIKIIMDIDELLPSSEHSRSPTTPGSYKRITTDKGHSLNYVQVLAPSSYLSPIEENSETSSTSSKSRREDLKSAKQNVTLREEPISMNNNRNREEINEKYCLSSGKYHTYPKSRIPVLRKTNEKKLKMMDPYMYPLEPREIELEAFQQLHTANSQEELQEFLLLESQCSGTVGLGSDISSHEMYYHDDQSDDERATMSGIFVLQHNIILCEFFFILKMHEYVCFFFLTN